MHLVATDVTIWLRVLIDQTLYEFTVYRSQEQNLTISADHVPSLAREDTTYGLLNPAHPTVKGKLPLSSGTMCKASYLYSLCIRRLTNLQTFLGPYFSRFKCHVKLQVKCSAANMLDFR